MKTEDMQEDMQMETENVKVRARRPATSRTRRSVRLGARFTAQERELLTSLRDRYQQGRDHFSRSELSRLRFVRWLYRSSRIDV